MKTKAISSFFVLFALVAGLSATMPDAFADHGEVTIDTAEGSGFGTECAVAEGGSGCYAPMAATVDQNGKVIMTNSDASVHTYTSGTVDGFTPSPDGVFDSNILNQGESFEWIADVEPGTYPYYCMLHTWMIGEIIVQEVEAAEEEHEEAHEEEHMEETHEEEHMEEEAHGEETMEMAEDMTEGEPSATGMLSDGTMVKVWSGPLVTGMPLPITIEFEGAEHVNHDIMVTQNGVEMLNDVGAHHHDGKGLHTTAALDNMDPIEITVTFQGYGIDEKTGPIGEQVVFSNVVPEFGTIAMMILAVAIISIIAVTAKSRVVPRF